jgi:chemotaxis protein methyltransferase CheR
VAADDPPLPAPGALRALSAACGLDLASFRAAHVARCVDRAIRRTGAPDAETLAALVAREPEQRRRFRRAVAVSTTRMFRDAQQFDLLAGLLDGLRQGPRPLRVWSVGASDGSELCSVALLLDSRGLLDGTTLLGSDLLEENVALAHERSRERLAPQQRDPVRFERRDVATSAPAGAWDVILCRNVLIHLSSDARARLLRRAVDGLRPGGLLLLGRSERVTRPETMGLRDAAPNAYWRVA